MQVIEIITLAVRRILSVGNERRKTTCLAKTGETLWISQCLIQVYCQIKRIEILKRNPIKFWTPSFSCPLSCLRSYRWFDAFLYTMEMINASCFICSWTIAATGNMWHTEEKTTSIVFPWYLITWNAIHKHSYTGTQTQILYAYRYRYRAFMFNSWQVRSITTLRQNNNNHITIDTKHGCATKAKLQL